MPEWFESPNGLLLPITSLAMRGFMRWWVVDRHGEILRGAPDWQPNMILNDGMNTIGGSFGGPRLITDCFTHAQASTGAAATSINGGGDTLQQAGQTVTMVSGTFDFVAQGIAVGDSIKFGAGGVDVMVTVVNGVSTLTVNIAQTVAATTFQFYKTSQNSSSFNTAQEERTNTYLTGSPFCGTVIAAPLITHTRTYDFPIRTGGSKNYTEIGMCWNAIPGTANTSFARMLINGGSVTVNNGERLRVAYALALYMGSTGGVAKSMGVFGWPISPATDTTGTERLQLPGVSTISSSNGALSNSAIAPATIDAFYCNEPAGVVTGNSVAFLSTNSTAPSTFNTDPTVRATLATAVMSTSPAYVVNSFYMIKQATFSAGVGTSTGIRSIGIGTTQSARDAGTNTGYVFVFTQAQTKNAGNQLVLNFRYNWSRILA